MQGRSVRGESRLVDVVPCGALHQRLLGGVAQGDDARRDVSAAPQPQSKERMSGWKAL